MTIVWNLENEYRAMSAEEQLENANELGLIMRNESSEQPTEATREQLELLCRLLDHPISLYV